MARRIEVELTSVRDDGTWTWRAAGAREPKGVLDGTLLYEGVRVGDVVRAEAEFDVEGITVLAVRPPKESRPESARLELLGSRDDERPETSTRRQGPREPRERKGERPSRRRPQGRPPRRAERASAPGDEAAAAPARSADGEVGAERKPDEGKKPRTRRERTPRPRPSETPARPKPKRLRPARAHRKAVLESLSAEQRPIAEHVLAGGIPAVRSAIEKQNEELRTEGKAEIKAEPLVALAEDLLPRLRTAEWRDRGEAALADIDDIDLRDLRSVVVAADSAARDEPTRELAAQLRDALGRRLDTEHRQWIADLTTAINEERVVRALRLSSRPPKAGALLPGDLTTRLTEAASAALNADASADRWGAVLDALTFAPVRRAVIPASIPAKPSDELQTTVAKLAGRLPEIATRFGIEPAPSDERPRGRRPSRSAKPS